MVDPLIALGLVIAGICAGFVLAVGLARWRAARGRDLIGEAAKSMDAAQDATADVIRDNEQLRAAIERERTRSEELFKAIDGMVEEKNTAMRLYHQQASEHGNAQQMMLREIGLVATQYDRLRGAVAKAETIETARELAKRPLRRNQALQQIADEFFDQHVAPNQPTPSPEPSATVG